MAHPRSSAESTKVRQLVTAAFRWTASEGANTDTILSHSHRQSEFDFYVQAVANYLGIVITPNEARLTLLRLRIAGLLSSSSGIGR
jgi:hypothetical protein